MSGTISTKELAAVLGISVQRVNELGRKGKITRESDGKWNLVKTHTQLKASLDSSQVRKSLGQKRDQPETEADGTAKPGGTFLDAQCRHEWLKVDKEQLALQIRRGELIEKSGVKDVWTQGLTSIKNHLSLLPDKLAPKLLNISNVLDARAIIHEEVRRLLLVLSEPKADAA